MDPSIEEQTLIATFRTLFPTGQCRIDREQRPEAAAVPIFSE